MILMLLFAVSPILSFNFEVGNVKGNVNGMCEQWKENFEMLMECCEKEKKNNGTHHVIIY